MGILDWLSGGQEVAIGTVEFRDDGRHTVTIDRAGAAPADLNGPVLATAMFLHYAAKALHALGSGGAGDELRRHVALTGVFLASDRFEPFTSFIDKAGRCTGRLKRDSGGQLSMYTAFSVPIRDTNNYVMDSTLLFLSQAASVQSSADGRKALGQAIQIMEQFYNSVAQPSSLKGMRGAPTMALQHYREAIG
jgi:hypothetical protein